MAEIDAKKLAAELRSLQEQGKAFLDKRKEVDEAGGESKLGQIVTELRTANQTVAQARKGYSKIRNMWLGFYRFYEPVGKFLGKVLGPPARAYKWLWDKTDHKKFENKWAKGAVKAARGMLMVWTASLGAQMLDKAVPDAFGGTIITPVAETLAYFTTEPVYDASRMALFGIQKETVYLSRVNEVDHANGVFTVSGCENYGECDDTNSLFYKVQPRLMHNLWKLANKGSFFFIPDQEVAPITSGAAPFAYEVTSYGARWRIAKRLQAYPEVLCIERIEMPGAAAPKFNDAAGATQPGQQTPAPVIAPQAPAPR